MKERPIIMQEDSVLGVLEGRKRQTRRVMKPQPSYSNCQQPASALTEKIAAAGVRAAVVTGVIKCPYGQPGDRLWIRETFWQRMRWDYTSIEDKAWCPDSAIRYVATDSKPDDVQDTWWRMKPSIFMTQRQSRLTLEILKVRAERVQDISEADVEAEGVRRYRRTPGQDGGFPEGWHDARAGYGGSVWIPSAFKDAYRVVWDSINAKRAGGIYAWANNPWVWVLEFNRV